MLGTYLCSGLNIEMGTRCALYPDPADRQFHGASCQETVGGQLFHIHRQNTSTNGSMMVWVSGLELTRDTYLHPIITITGLFHDVVCALPQITFLCTIYGEVDGDVFLGG